MKIFKEKHIYTWEVYPTVFSSVINFDNEEHKEGMKVDLHIYDISGRHIMSKMTTKIQNELDLSNISEGIYIYNIVVNDLLVKSGKLVKQ